MPIKDGIAPAIKFEPPTIIGFTRELSAGMPHRDWLTFKVAMWGEWWRIDKRGNGRADRVRQAQAEVDELYRAPARKA